MAPPLPASQPTRIYLRTGVSIRGVALGGVVAVRSERNYSRFHLSDGSVIVDLHPLKRWDGVLPKAQLARVHRRAIIGVAWIEILERRESGGWQDRAQGIKAPRNVSQDCYKDLGNSAG